VWVRKDLGAVVRIDPARTTELKSIQVADELCQGLGADDRAVWTCTDAGLARIDPATDKVAAEVKVDKQKDQGQIPVAFGHAWVLTGDGSKLAGVADDKVEVTVDLGTRCTELAASAAAIWAACPFEGQAVRVDPGTAAVTGRVQGLKDARTIAAAGTVWVGFAGGLARIDDASAKVTAVADAAPGYDGGITATDRDVWVRADGRFLRRVDATTVTVVEELTAPESSGGSVMVAAGSVWATAFDDEVLYRLKMDA
jgi:hypothetical protein